MTTYFIVVRANYQIDGGAAYITWSVTAPRHHHRSHDRPLDYRLPASESVPQPDQIYTLIMRFLNLSKRFLCTSGQKRRDAEYGIKLGQARVDLLGEKPQEFICLNVLAADPAVHGKGYGRALMELLCATVRLLPASGILLVYYYAENVCRRTTNDGKFG